MEPLLSDASIQGTENLLRVKNVHISLFLLPLLKEHLNSGERDTFVGPLKIVDMFKCARYQGIFALVVPKVCPEWRFYFIWIKKPISIPHRDYFVNEVEIDGEQNGDVG